MIRIFCVQLSFLSLSHHQVPMTTKERFYNYREQVFDIFQVIYDMTPKDESYS